MYGMHADGDFLDSAPHEGITKYGTVWWRKCMSAGGLENIQEVWNIGLKLIWNKTIFSRKKLVVHNKYS